MRIARFEARTSVEGPGERSALWLQGCSIKCPDCCNPEMHDQCAGEEISINALAKKIISAHADGLTILGGEPLDQSIELILLLQQLAEAGYHGIILFSGYEWHSITADQTKRRATSLCDLVVAGPFDKKQTPSSRRWIGSENQTTHFITDFYAGLQKDWPQNMREIEIFIKDNVIMVNGTPLSSEDELSLIFAPNRENRT